MKNSNSQNSAGAKNSGSNKQPNQYTGSQNRTSNSASNEHKHPNQYTKGADDEGGKNRAQNRASNAKNCR